MPDLRNLSIIVVLILSELSWCWCHIGSDFSKNSNVRLFLSRINMFRPKREQTLSDYDSTVIDLENRAWFCLLGGDSFWSPSLTSQSITGILTAWKHRLPSDVYGSAYSVVKAKGVVRASPSEIFDMIYDSLRTKEYNKYSLGRSDVAIIGSRTKIVWNRTNPPGTKRPHDFCTLMHGLIFPQNGTHVLMTTATNHPAAKPSDAYLRSEIIIGVNLLRPIGPRLTEVTTISHIKTSGVPSFLVEQFAAGNAMDFIKKLDSIFNPEGSARNNY